MLYYNFYYTGGPTIPLAPIILAPIPRTGPLGDGSPITQIDTGLTLDWLDKLTATLNLTDSEQEAYEALSLDGDNLVEMLTAVQRTMDTSGSTDKSILETDKSVHMNPAHEQSINHSHTNDHVHSLEHDKLPTHNHNAAYPNKTAHDLKESITVDKESQRKEDTIKLQRQSTSNDQYSPEDSIFDIMIRNNENLITALIGKSQGDGSTNLLKTVNDGIVKGGKTIAQKIEGVKMGIDSFKQKLSLKFAAIKTWSAVIAGHQHGVIPAGK